MQYNFHIDHVSAQRMLVTALMPLNAVGEFSFKHGECEWSCCRQFTINKIDITLYEKNLL